MAKRGTIFWCGEASCRHGRCSPPDRTDVKGVVWSREQKNKHTVYKRTFKGGISSKVTGAIYMHVICSLTTILHILLVYTFWVGLGKRVLDLRVRTSLGPAGRDGPCDLRWVWGRTTKLPRWGRSIKLAGRGGAGNNWVASYQDGSILHDKTWYIYLI